MQVGFGFICLNIYLRFLRLPSYNRDEWNFVHAVKEMTEMNKILHFKNLTQHLFSETVRSDCGSSTVDMFSCALVLQLKVNPLKTGPL